MDLQAFVEELSRRSDDDEVYNPYGHHLQRHNLEIYLTRIKALKPKVLMVGEAPGYRGCSRSGIPFTAPGLLSGSNHLFLKDLRKDLYLSDEFRESTASVLWEYLKDYSMVPILWNAFPFHPHKKNKLSSNRKPRQGELAEGQKYLKWLLEIFEPAIYIGVGRVGEEALKKQRPHGQIHYVRHPSHGGSKDFKEGMDTLLWKTSYSLVNDCS